MNFVKKPIFEENLTPVNDRETRQQILKAAQQLFLAKGYKGVSMKDVAEAVQVTSAALYYHFPDGKQEIFFSVIQMMLEEWSRGALLATSSAQGLRERLNRLTQYLFTLPIDRLAVTSSQDTITLASAVKQNVVPTLQGIDGVANVNVTGVEQQIVKVTMDLTGTGNTSQLPVGTQTPTVKPTSIKLSDVAAVEQTLAPSTSTTHTNGKPSIGIAIIKTNDGNTVSISHAILVILVFLFSLRSRLVTAISIPLSIVIAHSLSL